jgi:hypothetical protein
MVALVIVIEPLFSAAKAGIHKERSITNTIVIDKNFFMITFLSEK